MGAAANYRGDRSIHRSLYAEFEGRWALQDMARALAVAEECNAFVRDAMAFLVEPRGLRQSAIEAARKRRGWTKRNDALCSAHIIWVDVNINNSAAYIRACIARAQAAYRLLSFALMGWTMPEHIQVPRAATTSI